MCYGSTQSFRLTSLVDSVLSDPEPNFCAFAHIQLTYSSLSVGKTRTDLAFDFKKLGLSTIVEIWQEIGSLKSPHEIIARLSTNPGLEFLYERSYMMK